MFIKRIGSFNNCEVLEFENGARVLAFKARYRNEALKIDEASVVAIGAAGHLPPRFRVVSLFGGRIYRREPPWSEELMTASIERRSERSLAAAVGLWVPAAEGAGYELEYADQPRSNPELLAVCKKILVAVERLVAAAERKSGPAAPG